MRYRPKVTVAHTRSSNVNARLELPRRLAGERAVTWWKDSQAEPHKRSRNWTWWHTMHYFHVTSSVVEQRFPMYCKSAMHAGVSSCVVKCRVWWYQHPMTLPWRSPHASTIRHIVGLLFWSCLAAAHGDLATAALRDQENSIV